MVENVTNRYVVRTVDGNALIGPLDELILYAVDHPLARFHSILCASCFSVWWAGGWDATGLAGTMVEHETRFHPNKELASIGTTL